MNADCCYGFGEPTWTEDDRVRAELGHSHAPEGEEEDFGFEHVHPMLPAEPCCGVKDNRDREEPEEARALDFMYQMCLDRPCPGCKSEVVDKPSADLRQCRACGEVWGFDDTQTLEEFVKEFARMDPCPNCGNDRLDEFQVVDGRGRHEIVCMQCQRVQEYRRGVEENGRIDGDREVEHTFRKDELPRHQYELPLHQDGLPRHQDGLPRHQDGLPRHQEELPLPQLTCPNCPEMTADFFEKNFENGELVRAVCHGCGNVVFPTPGGQGKQEGHHFRRQVSQAARRALHRIRVRPVELGEEREGEEDVSLCDVAERRLPGMVEQLGWTIGTTVGSILIRDQEVANATGNAGALVGKKITEKITNRLGLKRR